MQGKIDRKQVKTFSGLSDIPLYPLSYAKVLMQIGHEPLPPFQSTSLFGSEQLYYPNMFKYLKHIYAVEGITGLYRGFGMRLLNNFLGNQVYAYANAVLDELEKKEQPQEELEGFSKFFKETSREITTRCWALFLTHPFHVMTIRCMAQFVGGETKYSSWNVIQNSIVIYKGEGVTGFFSGLVPRLLFEAATIGITGLISYLIKNYVFTEKETEFFIDLISSSVATSITYPLSVVSTVTVVSGCGLLAGQAPRMVFYASWIDALKHLHENNQLKRGGSMFFRVYTPTPVPTVPSGFKVNTINRASITAKN